MAARFIKIAVLYLLVGVCFGGAMGATGNFTLAPVHAHILLLGWVTLALAGILYTLYPAAAETRLATIHFWAHNLALPVFMGALAMLLSGNNGAMPVVAITSSIVILGVACFVVNIWLTVKRPA